MTDLRRDTDDIRALLLGQIDRLAAELAPDGRRSGGYWIARNPTRADRNAGSFWVHLTGKPGAWADAATGDKGDVFMLVQYCKALPDFKATIQWCREWLRLPAMSDTERARMVAKSRAAIVQDTAETDERAAKAAFGLFCAAQKQKFIGSPADLYLKGRSLDVEKLGRMPGSLGWLPDQRHVESDRKFHCMIAGFTAPDGSLAAVHRTFLAQDADGKWVKAPVVSNKKIWPRGWFGSAIRLWRGKTGKSVDWVARQGERETLVLVEGIEDGLSVALARPDLRVWAVGTLGGLSAVRLPECVDDVIVCADNDWGKPDASKALGKGLEALMAQGVTVSVARSHIGKDVNDALRGAA